MTPLEVAQALKVIKQKELACNRSASQNCHNIADAIVTVDPASAASPYPSANHNGVFFLGCEARVSRDYVTSIRNLFDQAGIERFFVHLGPTPQRKEIIDWLLESGLERFFGPQYLTLIRPVHAEPAAETSLRIARVDAEELQLHEDVIAGIYQPWPISLFMDSRGQPGFEHFLAYEGNTPVSAAMLVTHGDFAYLGWAATAEAHRGKGGQNALIRARLNRAAELGCQVACSETLSMLQASLRNLERNGFQVLYEKQVYCYEAP